MIPLPKLQQIRSLMLQQNLSAYLIPHNDAHDSEYIAVEDERIAYISGFTGSAGTAVVFQDRALLWTDSRYWLQAQKELDSGWELRKQMKGVLNWFEECSLSLQNQKIGFDPSLVSASIYETRNKKLAESNIEFVSVQQNLVDTIWQDKQFPSKNQIIIHDLEFISRSIDQKLQETFTKIRESKSNSTLIANLAQISCIQYNININILGLLNLRGSDIQYNPVFKSYLYLIEQDQQIQGILYVDLDKLNQSTQSHLNNSGIQVKHYDTVFEDAHTFDSKVLINKAEINTRLYSLLKGQSTVDCHPIENLKAVKDAREIRGFRESHVRDGAALCRFLAWLEYSLVVEGHNDLDEYGVTLVLEKFRSQAKHNAGLSFATISSSGPNAAVIHYHPREGISSPVVRDQIYLLDSGGQYYDGTTDVTRTMHFGTPTQEEKNAYTRVLLGNLDVERLQYPANANIHGGDIDVLARRWLWANGLDYGHGTGHGVGYFLNVHEGPNGISKHRTCPLVPGMVTSNGFLIYYKIIKEPGYYKDGSFGIRIENLLLGVETAPNFWGFENLTICPYDKNLMDHSLLNPEYVGFINQYHLRVRELLTPQIEAFNDQVALEWLNRRTQLIELNC